LNWEIFPKDEFVKGEIQRKSNSYGTYQAIESMGSYASNFTDNDILLNNSVVYYRLKIIDKDNKINYSKELSINKKDIKTVNFSSNATTVTIEADSKLGGTIKVFQTDGKVVIQSQITKQSQTINLSNLPDGIYNTIVQQGGITSTYRFYKSL
jgi:formylmethanofuran dehydrogenase subunit D